MFLTLELLNICCQSISNLVEWENDHLSMRGTASTLTLSITSMSVYMPKPTNKKETYITLCKKDVKTHRTTWEMLKYL